MVAITIDSKRSTVYKHTLMDGEVCERCKIPIRGVFLKGHWMNNADRSSDKTPCIFDHAQRCP